MKDFYGYFLSVSRKMHTIISKNNMQLYPEIVSSWLKTLSQVYADYCFNIPFRFSCNISNCAICGYNPMSKLNVWVRLYCQDIRQRVVCGKIIKGRKIVRSGNDNDYPAMAVTCKKSGDDEIEMNYSDVGKKGVLKQNKQSFTRVLRKVLLKIQKGGIGKSTYLCKNNLGNCAEPRAANMVMKKTKCSIDQLEFSVAMRPRTMTVHAYCKNCQKVFSFCSNHNIIKCACDKMNIYHC